MMIAQTTLIPRLAFASHFFDLMLALVIYLAVFRPLPEALPFMLFLGVLMDNVSGGPFGLYLTSYVWVFIGARAAAKVVRAESAILIVLTLISAVAAQNALFLATRGVAGHGDLPAGWALRLVTEQIGWVLLIGPFLAWGMRHAQRSSARRIHRTATTAPAAEP
jgi:rod shape-determining protein MreD